MCKNCPLESICEERIRALDRAVDEENTMLVADSIIATAFTEQNPVASTTDRVELILELMKRNADFARAVFKPAIESSLKNKEERQCRPPWRAFLKSAIGITNKDCFNPDRIERLS